MMTVQELTPEQLLIDAGTLSETLSDEASEYDQQNRINFSAFERVRKLRLGALRVPQIFGGAGGSIPQLVTLMMSVAAGDSSVAQALLPHFVFVERTRLMATETQQENFLKQVAAGDLVGGASAESGGRFRGEVSTRVTRQGQLYRLSGEKIYSTGALMGQILKVVALNDDDQSVLVVIPADRHGITRHDDWRGMGQRGTMSGRTELNNVLVEEQEIFQVHHWQNERHHTGAASQILHCAIQAGIARAALREAANWARNHLRAVKESGDSRGSADPYVLHKVGEMVARTRAAEAMIFRAAEKIELAAEARFSGDSSQNTERLAIEASVATAEAKVIVTESSLFACQALFDAGGAALTLQQQNADRHWRNARTHASHDPLAWKNQAVGNWRVNDIPPPVSYLY